MKKILSILAVTLLMTACGSVEEKEACCTTDSTCVAVDTTVAVVDSVATDSVSVTDTVAE